MMYQPDVCTWREGLNLELSRAYKRVESLDAEAIDDLGSQLGPIYDKAKADDDLATFKGLCASSDLYRVLSADPYTLRAREKPRGYAGDAVMLDYIYRPLSRHLTGIANVLHSATTGSSNAQSIIWRRNFLADQIIKTLKRPEPRILSVASGHMRELDVVRVATRNRTFHLTAMDQDEASLRQCVADYPDFSISPICENVLAILRNRITLDRYDLIYSAGLFDYLNDRTASALAKALLSLLAPGGSLVIGNFNPENHGRGFMEGFMDWKLILRDEKAMTRLLETDVAVEVPRSFRDAIGNVSYLEITRR